jgi:ankyrin repeat protein
LIDYCAVHVAARHGNHTTCVLLRRNGARVNSINSAGETPLHIAAKHGHEQVVPVLMHTSNVLCLDAMALTPLHHAVRNNQPNVVDKISTFLLDQTEVREQLFDYRDQLVIPTFLGFFLFYFLLVHFWHYLT